MERLQQKTFLLAFLRQPIGSIGFFDECDRVVEPHIAAAAFIAMPIGNQIMRDAIEPGSKRRAAIVILVYVCQGAIENARGQVLGILFIADAVKNVTVDAVNVP